MLDVRFAHPIAIADLRAALDRPDLSSISVQDVGGSGAQFQIVARQGSDETGSVVTALKNALTQRFGEGAYEILERRTSAPRLGRICGVKRPWRSWLRPLSWASISPFASIFPSVSGQP